MPADLDHFAPQIRGNSAKQGVRGRPAGLFAVDLSLAAGDFRLQDFDPLRQFRHSEHLQVLAKLLPLVAATLFTFTPLMPERVSDAVPVTVIVLPACVVPVLGEVIATVGAPVSCVVETVPL